MKKFFKRTLAFFLAAVMVIGATPLAGFVGLELLGFKNPFATKAEAATSGKCGDNVTWTLDNGELTISGIGAMYDYEYPSYSPWYINRGAVRSVTICSGVTSIGVDAFDYCMNLTDAFIPNTVTRIGDGAFNECYNLKEIQIPNGVTIVGDGAFKYCSSLTSIVVPNSVIHIGSHAFQYCENLVDIILPDNLSAIGFYAFHDTGFYKDLTNWENDGLYINEYLLHVKNDTTYTKYSVIDGTEIIAGGAFYCCDSVVTITLPKSIKYIGPLAFSGCKSLSDITIPNGVRSIESYTFDSCKSLTNINLPDTIINIADHAFNACMRLGDITIPNGVINIGNYAFYQCYALEEITIPSSVMSIGNKSFEWCTALTSVTFGQSITSINDYAFSNCKKISDVYYIGSEKDWSEIEIGDGNEYLLDAIIHFNYIWGEDGFEGVLEIESIYPQKNVSAISIDDDLILTFNQLVEDSFYFETAEKEISIRNYYTDEPIVVINDENFLDYWSLIEFNGSTITISDVFRKICPGEKYYITISPGIISAKGDYSKTFAGITDKDEWTFTYSDETEKKGYNFEVYSSRSSFNMNKGETLNAKVVLTFNGEKCTQEGISYTIGDSAVAKIKSMTHDESGTTFVIEAVNYGVTNLDIIYAAGALRESYIIKVADEKTVYYLNDIKGRSQGDNPFYTCGLYVDSLDYTELADGRANVTFDVYNYSHCYGAVEVYDASGNLINSEMISMFNGEYNTDFISYGTYAYKVGRDAFTGDLFDNDIYKTDVKTQKTSISVSVPKNGYIVITKNVSESMPCLLYNITLLAIEGASSASKIIHDGKFKSSDDLIKGIVDATAQKISWKDLAVSLSSSVTKKIVNNFISAGNELNIMSMLDATEGIYDELDEFYKSFDIEWADIVISTAKKMFPNTTIQFITGFTLGKLGGDIVDLYFFGPIGIAKYCEMLAEIVDYTDVSGTYIYNSQEGNTRYSNKVIAKSDAIPDDVVFHSVLIKSGKVNDVLNNGYTNSRDEAELYDISLVKNGNKIQPNGKVQVHIPIPAGWDSNEITVHHETSYRNYEKLDVTIEDGYIVFYTDSFSDFIIVNGNVTLSTPVPLIRTPSTTTISYGDSIILHADLSEALPSGWRIEWSASNGNFDMTVSADGATCTISPSSKGDTTFTATVYDAQGNEVSTDEQTMTSKAGFFDKLIAFFKKIFGLTKTIPQAFKRIF